VALRIAILGSLACLLTAVSVAQTSATPDTRSIVDRMLRAQQENKAKVRPFTVKRGYLLLDKQDQQKAQVVANITVLPPDSKQYNIESSSGGMGKKFYETFSAKRTEPPRDAQRKELSLDNYNFQLLGEQTLDGQRCFLLSMNPRREEKDLLRGKLWVDAETYNIRRVEERLLKILPGGCIISTS